MTVRYISTNDGEKLRTASIAAVGDFVKSNTNTGGFVAFFDLKSESTTDWARAASGIVPPLPQSSAYTLITDPTGSSSSTPVNFGGAPRLQ
jgi:hypothetical protein